jgi:hypothetical protein
MSGALTPFSQMTFSEFCLSIIAVACWLYPRRFRPLLRGSKKQFPTEAEQDAEWAQKDPMGQLGSAQRKKGIKQVTRSAQNLKSTTLLFVAGLNESRGAMVFPQH